LTRFVSLSEFLWLAEQVTGTDADVLSRSSRLNLADSALHAPQASFGGQDLYPDLIDKAAVLAYHLAWKHPLVDGNKRSSWASLVMFLDLNDVVWDPDPLTSMKRNRQCSPSGARSGRSLVRHVDPRTDAPSQSVIPQRRSATPSSTG